MDDFKPQQTPPQKPDKPQGFPQSPPDNEPETYVTPEGRPTTLGESHVEAQPQVAVAPKKSSASKWVLSGVAILLIGAAAALAFWQWAETQNAKQELSSAQEQLKTAQASLADLKKTEDKSANESAANQPGTDTDLIKSEIESFLASGEKNSYVYVAEYVKTEGAFAVAKTSMPNTGANPKVVVLEKAKDNWVVIYSVVGPIPAAEKDRLTTEFGVPKTLLAD